MRVQRSPPVVPPLDAVEADGAVGSEQDDQISEDVEQQSVRVQLRDGRKGIVQVRRALIEPQLVSTEREKKQMLEQDLRDTQ